MTNITVVKRDGSREPLNLEKLHRQCAWACEGLTGVSISELELQSQVQFFDGIKTSDVQETLIRAASQLITEDAPNYQYVAGRLINYDLRKKVYGQYEPTHLLNHFVKVAAVGFYDDCLLSAYVAGEFVELNKYIKHDRDFDIVYAGMEQMRGKYLIKNRVTGEFYETPQMAMMLLAMTLFKNYPVETRLDQVKSYYDALSTFDINLPTPIMAGVRSPDKQWSSCVLIEAADDLDSIASTGHAIIKHVANRAGIGIGASRIRAVKSPVAGGQKEHTGVTSFYRFLDSSKAAVSQGGLRVSAATINVLFWHLEIEDILQLKNEKGTEATRVRGLDYAVQVNRVMYERLLQGKNITLFCPNDVPQVYDAYFGDADVFRELYEKAEANPNIRRKSIPAKELWEALMQERKDTGRVYIMNVDHCNTHSSFEDPISMTNLCTEITLPTGPFYNVRDEEGEIALCVLAASNWGKAKSPKDFEQMQMTIARGLDSVISEQQYLMPASEKMKKRRSIGVGIVNFAYWMAKQGFSYQDVTKEQLQVIHEYAEAWSYYLLKASVELAKEFGPCEWFYRTKYAQGILPIDTYKREVDELVDPIYHMDWEGLRIDIFKYGMRFSAHMAQMPAETSAQVSNATNGVEPPRALVSIKKSKDGILAQVVPEVKRLKNRYDLLPNQKSPEGYLKIMAVLQKFMDQAMSVNFAYNSRFYPDGQVPMSALIRDHVNAYKWGHKTAYYCTTFDGAGEIDLNLNDDCEACKL